MRKELAEVIVENGIDYHLVGDGCYYPDVSVEQNTDYPAGKWILKQMTNHTGKKINGYLQPLHSFRLLSYPKRSSIQRL